MQYNQLVCKPAGRSLPAEPEVSNSPFSAKRGEESPGSTGHGGG
jgi:hypothetical protein